MSKPARKLIARDQLNQLMTKQLQAFEDLEDATLGVRYVYPDADESGCNWSPDVILNPGTKGFADYATPFVSQIVRAARALYNVKD